MIRFGTLAFFAMFLAIDAVDPIGDTPIWKMYRDYTVDMFAIGTDEQMANRSFEERCKQKSILPFYNKIVGEVCKSHSDTTFAAPPAVDNWSSPGRWSAPRR